MAYEFETDEWRSALHATPELERAHPTYGPAGMRMDEREDVGWDDVR